MSINLNTFWTTWGVLSGNTSATNQYDFWKGMVMTGGTQINSQYDFFTFNNTTRYKFFNDLNSTYPEVWDETTFYQNTNDARIYDYNTFYQYGAQYLSGGTPSPTPTPTPSPTPTPTPPASYDWIISDGSGAFGCAATSASTVYTTGRTLSTGDIFYTDSNLTTPVNGLGDGAYYDVWYNEPVAFCNTFISSGGTITLQGMCGDFGYISGNAEDSAGACSFAIGDYEVRTSTTIGAYIWQDLYGSYYPPTSLVLYNGGNVWAQVMNSFTAIQISTGGEVLDSVSC